MKVRLRDAQAMGEVSELLREFRNFGEYDLDRNLSMNEREWDFYRSRKGSQNSFIAIRAAIPGALSRSSRTLNGAGAPQLRVPNSREEHRSGSRTPDARYERRPIQAGDSRGC